MQVSKSYLIIILSLVTSAYARTIYVDANGTGDYPTIQAAIDDANEGDDIILLPGTYTGNGNRDIDFLGKAITVRSTNPNNSGIVAATIIDCNGTEADPHGGFYFHSGEEPNSVVAGLTIIGGYGCHYGSFYENCGGGIFAEDSSPTIKHCRIIGNSGGSGGGIFCTNSGPTISSCVIAGNLSTNSTGTHGGGGIHIDGGKYYHSGEHSDPNLINCTIVNNSAVGYGGGIIASFYCHIAIDNCILWGNTAPQGHEVAIAPIDDVWEPYITISYCDIQEGRDDILEDYGYLQWGQGNIDSDPLFAYPATHDYHLLCDSPCIDTGDPNYVPEPNETDIDGEPRVINGRIDMGVDELDYEGPCIEISPTSLEFYADENGPNPAIQVLSIRNKGTDTLFWEITEDCNWLEVDPNSGESTGEIDDVNVSVDIDGLEYGTYNCELLISDRTVVVTLYIAEELHVPSEYGTIQAAINDANNGDTVVVASGIHKGPGNRDIDFLGKAITVRSTNPNNWDVMQSTVIDCNGTEADPHRGFYFHSGEGENSVLAGLTITNAYSANGSGPIGGNNSDGAGIFCISGSSPTISYCTIRGNSTDGYAGGGIGCRDSNPTIINCIIAGNSAGHLAGGGIYCYYSSPIITNCTITNNNASLHGGGLRSHDSNPTVSNSIIWANTGSIIVSGGIATFFYNDLEPRSGGSGSGNISVDPCFANPAACDYHLSACSFCVNGGDPCYSVLPGETDIDGQPRIINGRIDIGADELNYEGPLLGILPTELSFYAQQGGPNPESQILPIRNNGTGTLNWEITEDCEWLEVDPNSGESTGETDDVNVIIDTVGLAPAEYNYELTVTADGVINSPQTVSVVLYIDDNDDMLYVPSEYPTIQAAVDWAEDGDVVIVADGVYTGDGNRDITFNGKAITVCSENGPSNCIIDCQGSPNEPHRAFIFSNYEGPDTVLDGFTIREGCEEAVYEGVSGGGMFIRASSPKIMNCIFYNNTALEGGTGGAAGILELCDYYNPEIINCTFNNNTADEGGAIGICGGMSDSVKIRNCIMWGNQESDLSNIAFDKCGYAIVQVDLSLLLSYYGSSIYLEDCISADPCFADPCGHDYHLKSQAGRWDPNSKTWVTNDVNSPAIDAGDPNSDWTAELWPHGKRINMGAYGGTSQASMSPNTIGNPADFDNDDDVDANDLSLLTDVWPITEILLKEDIDRNGLVDFLDFAVFANNWLWEQ